MYRWRPGRHGRRDDEIPHRHRHGGAQDLREQTREDIVLLISHRLYLFPKMDRIIWMEDGRATVGTHEELMVKVPEYQKLFASQTKDGQKGGEAHDA